MQTKLLVERLFWQKNYSKILRLSELCRKDEKLKVVEEAPKDLKVGETGSLFIIENPNPESIYFVEDFRDKKDDEIKVCAISYEPDVIQWENMTHSKAITGRLTSILAVLVVIGLTILVLHVFTVNYLDKFDKTSVFFNDNYSCSDQITLQDAQADFAAPQARKQEGLLTCFCRQQFAHGNFAELFSVDAPFCKEWL